MNAVVHDCVDDCVEPSLEGHCSPAGVSVHVSSEVSSLDHPQPVVCQRVAIHQVVREVEEEPPPYDHDKVGRYPGEGGPHDGCRVDSTVQCVVDCVTQAGAVFQLRPLLGLEEVVADDVSHQQRCEE